jgi:hypothetical protein
MVREYFPEGFVPYQFSEHNQYVLDTEDQFIRLLEEMPLAFMLRYLNKFTNLCQ